MAPSALSNGGQVPGLLDRLRPGQRHSFLQPSASIPSEALQMVKDTLEAFAGQVSDEQAARLAESRKRKRTGGGGGLVAGDVLKMRKVYVDGFETAQVWQQAKRIIGGVLEHSTTLLEELEEQKMIEANGEQVNGVGSGEDEEEEEDDEEEDDALDLQESDDEQDLLGGDDIEDSLAEDLEDDEEAEGGVDVDDDEEVEDEDEDEDGAHQQERGEDEDDGTDDDLHEELVEDPNGLNDGFFSIDDFNRQTQWFEDQDARGDPETDRVSDEEDIDWDADPLAPPKGGKKSKAKSGANRSASDDGGEEEEEEDDDDEAGPTFGNMDLDAPEGDSEDEAFGNGDGDGAEDDDDGMNANDIHYKDFFAPPARKWNKSKPDRRSKAVRFQPNEADVERAMADVRRDLFEDESEVEDSADALSDVSAGDPRSRRSAHERRQAKLAEEIRKLEAASVAKREWTLSGEATAVDRPTNSLLEQDLDFEHVGKPVPVITPEVSEDIEALIKRRILAQEFDEVLRRRPDAESTSADTRRGMLEAVDDSKATKGLAEVYEEEHVKNSNPDAYVSASDAALQREEREVEALWAAVTGQLDALSNWHYRPKPAATTISVVADVAAIAIEDAQPATAQGLSVGASAESRMAPQEIYKPGADNTAAAGEVVTSAGLPIARQEMTREEKLRRRRRAKERASKAGSSGGPGGNRPVSKNASTIADLKKAGVKVINRKGEITDIQGNKPKTAKPVTSGSFKL